MDELSVNDEPGQLTGQNYFVVHQPGKYVMMKYPLLAKGYNALKAKIKALSVSQVKNIPARPTRPLYGLLRARAT
jgi:hypothetical protein